MVLPTLKRPIRRTTLSESVYETLLEAILGGNLSSGAELSVVALAKELDVSRTPVHEALRHLAQDGLVTQEVNRKARVAHFTRDDFMEIFEMRILLEGAAAEKAATQTAETWAPLMAMADELSKLTIESDWLERWVEYDDNFHSLIAEQSGSLRLARDIARYRLLHRVMNRMAINFEDFQVALGQHRDILEALSAGDPAAAKQQLVGHIRSWQTYFANSLQEST